MTAHEPSVIEIKKLVKRFGSFTALDELDLTVAKGEVHGFLGPNGAGKSTTIRILLGLLRASGGTVTVLGGDPWRDAVELHRRLAYVPGEVNLWPNLSGGECIDLLCHLRGGVDPVRRAELLETFELNPAKKFRTYSKGNRQKVALVAVLAADVELYIFDEPTSGLDPLMEELFQKEVKRLKQRGKTVLLSSHILAEAEALCDRITIIRDGRTVETGTLEELRHLHRTVVEVVADVAAPEIASLPGVHAVETVNGAVKFEVETTHMSDTFAYLARHNVRGLKSQPPSLEDLFLRHYDTAQDSDGLDGRS